MNVLLTGGGGLIGSALMSCAAENDWRMVRLRRAGPGVANEPTWDPHHGTIDLSSAGSIDAVIHLAGESIAQRWTAAARQRIHESRIRGTQLLVTSLLKLPEAKRPRVFVGASAIGYYGERGDALVDEHDGAGMGFLADICRDWEAAAKPLGDACRTVHLRLGIVLSRRGGALAAMLPAFRLGLGGRLGSGRQFWSWVTLRDVIRVVERGMRDETLSGPINVVSPSPVRNVEFTRTLAGVLHRPGFFAVPAWVVRTVFGQMGREAMLASTRVRPTRLIGVGFEFHDGELSSALNSELCGPGTQNPKSKI